MINKAKREGSFVYVLNDQGSNLICFGVQAGFDDFGNRVSEKEVAEFAAFFQHAYNEKIANSPPSPTGEKD